VLTDLGDRDEKEVGYKRPAMAEPVRDNIEDDGAGRAQEKGERRGGRDVVRLFAELPRKRAHDEGRRTNRWRRRSMQASRRRIGPIAGA
jgi:hypothetical protein